MPSVLSYPGVYIEEVPSGARTISGVATSMTAFVGRALRGPVDTPVVIHGYADYERVFGGLWQAAPMSHAVRQYFLNGGADAVVVRIHNGATSATLHLSAPNSGELTLEAASPGGWGDRLEAEVDHDTSDSTDATLFNLFVNQVDAAGDTIRGEVFRNVSVDPLSSRFVGTVLAQGSQLVRATAPTPDERPDETGGNPATVQPGDEGGDGTAPGDTHYLGSEPAKTGLYALLKTDIFNLLVVAPPAAGQAVSAPVLDAALALCRDRRAILLMDPPANWTDKESAITNVAFVDGRRDPNAALFFPLLRMPDPLDEGRLADFPPSGAVAGIIARTDAQRGIWKAPAGIDAVVRGVRELTVKLTDKEQGDLNPVGVNCLRTFPVYGTVLWGSRTTAGADRLASEWKYLPVRRLALYLEESLYRGTQWVVFEPNDEPLWAQVRTSIGGFLQQLFRQGAFQGASPREAYFVKCDAETTTQGDIDRGVVNIMVGFAPLKPAEFVVLRIQQLAGQNEA